MKKILLYSITSLLALTAFQTNGMAKSGSVKTEQAADTLVAKNVLLNRLDEISAMDKSAFDAGEKKALRKETRTISKSLHDNYGGVYISAGALILIIILLIILL